MNVWIRSVLVLLSAFALVACGEEPSVESPGTEPQPPVSAVAPEKKAAAPAPSGSGSGGVQGKIVPESPTAADCLSLVVHGDPGRAKYQWSVNGQSVTPEDNRTLCNEHFKRGDQVSVIVGTVDKGVTMTVVINNALPVVSDISASPDYVTAETPLEIVPVGEDLDGDEVEFSYQWLINGEEDSFLTESILPAESFKTGDTVQVLITPFDGVENGPVYESYPITIENTQPQITSDPPMNFKTLTYTYQVEAVDPDGDDLTYSLEEAPEGMVIDAKSGLVRWPLNEVSAGSYMIRIVVEDTQGNTYIQEYEQEIVREE
jgi:hypothetical protein